jgi:hypothetical protein
MEIDFPDFDEVDTDDIQPPTNALTDEEKAQLRLIFMRLEDVAILKLTDIHAANAVVEQLLIFVERAIVACTGCRFEAGNFNLSRKTVFEVASALYRLRRRANPLKRGVGTNISFLSLTGAFIRKCCEAIAVKDPSAGVRIPSEEDAKSLARYVWVKGHGRKAEQDQQYYCSKRTLQVENQNLRSRGSSAPAAAGVPAAAQDVLDDDSDWYITGSTAPGNVGPATSAAACRGLPTPPAPPAATPPRQAAAAVAVPPASVPRKGIALACGRGATALACGRGATAAVQTVGSGAVAGPASAAVHHLLRRASVERAATAPAATAVAAPSAAPVSPSGERNAKVRRGSD